jgi:hypothetical protein
MMVGPTLWAKLNDSEIEETLWDYLWRASNTPNAHAIRVGQLVEEYHRRSSPETVDRARARNREARQLKAVIW